MIQEHNLNRSLALRWWRALDKDQQSKIVLSWQEANKQDPRSFWPLIMITASDSSIESVYDWYINKKI